MVSIVLAVLAAVSNAVSSVLQRKANIAESQERSFGPALLLHLLGRPAWLFGLLAMIVSFLLQATALGFGTLSTVEPLLALELPVSLFLGAAVFGRRLPRRDWGAAVGMAAGLALMLASLAPSGGDAEHLSSALTVTATGATLVGIAALVLVGRTGPRTARAALFGAAAGSGFGLTAALMKIAVAQLSAHGVQAALTTWETYGLVVAGIGSVGLVQAALNAGTLVAAQPGITLLDPLVSVLWGTVVTGEHTRTGPILVLAALGASVIVAAALALTRSPTAWADPDDPALL